MRTSERLLREVQRLVRLGWYRFTTHALDGMAIYGVSSDEVLDVILSATDCTVQSDERCRVEGTLETEVEVAVVIAIDNEAIIVTVFEVGA